MKTLTSRSVMLGWLACVWVPARVGVGGGADTGSYKGVTGGSPLLYVDASVPPHLVGRGHAGVG